jgi:hypothetical protein
MNDYKNSCDYPVQAQNLEDADSRYGTIGGQKSDAEIAGTASR